MPILVANAIWPLEITLAGAPDLSAFTVTWALKDSTGTTVASDTATGSNTGVMSYTYDSNGDVSAGAYRSVFTATYDDGTDTVTYIAEQEITCRANIVYFTAITAGEVIPSILDLINNPNKSLEAKEWVRETLREIAAYGRWNYLMTSKIHITGQQISFPDDWRETLDPLYIDTSYDITAMSGDWETASIWTFENLQRLRLQNFDYKIMNGQGIVLNTRWTGGAIWMDYYRDMTITPIPTYQASEGSPVLPYNPALEILDLPRDFAWKLLVYGAARFGLVGEDDFERLRYAEQKFAEALADMKAWDSRRGVANMKARLAGITPDQEYGMLLPSNYSV